MKKIKLNLDDLQVQSFDTTPVGGAAARGTVHGHGDTNQVGSCTCGGDTCAGGACLVFGTDAATDCCGTGTAGGGTFVTCETCAATCANTCANTCGASCNGTCAQTCAASCNGTCEAACSNGGTCPGEGDTCDLPCIPTAMCY